MIITIADCRKGENWPLIFNPNHIDGILCWFDVDANVPCLDIVFHSRIYGIGFKTYVDRLDVINRIKEVL